MNSAANGNESAVWRIDRFELIYYNARHRRWQYFAEDPLISASRSFAGNPSIESAHRRQVRRFLLMARQAIAKLIERDHTRQFVVRDDSSNVTSITLGHPEEDGFPGWREHWDDYLGYLYATGEHEGLTSTDLDTLSRLQQGLGSSSAGSCSLSRTSALSLLSLLPILEEWDTWGCFVRARRAVVDNRLDSQRFPPAHNGVDWFQPFYIAEFLYSPSPQSVGASGALLQSSVGMEAACSDLAASAGQVWFVEKSDFFDYCKRPASSERNDELYLYRCYSHFVDTLIQQLSAGSSDGDTGALSRKYFVIAYPVQVAGRLHFVQIAVTTADQAADVRKLWQAWAPLHQSFWTPQCVSTLEAELGRISLSAFQHAAGRELHKCGLGFDQITDTVLQDVLANHVYHLFPIRSLVKGDKRWRYVPYHDGIPGCILGYQWQPLTVETPISEGTAESNLIRFELSDQRIVGSAPRFGQSALQEPLTQQRAVQAIEQQLDYLRDLRLAIATEVSIAQKDEELAGRLVAMWVQNLSEHDRQKVVSASTDADITSLLETELDAATLASVQTPKYVPDGFTHSPHSLRRFLFQANPRGTNASSFQTLIKERATPSVLELASLFFDASLVKVYTHGFPVDWYFSGDLGQARSAVGPGGFLTTIYDKLCDRLASVKTLEGGVDVEDEMARLLQELKNAYADFVSHMHTIETLEDLKNAGNRGGQRGLGLWRHLQKQHFVKLFGAKCPQFRVFVPREAWMAQWIARYEADFREFVAPCLGRDFQANDACCSADTVSGVDAPLAFVGSKAVRLFHKLTWLPCYVTNFGRFTTNANIFRDWNHATDAFAQLYFVARNGGTREVSVWSGSPGSRRLDRVNPTSSVWHALQQDPATLPASQAAGHSLVLVHRLWEAEES